MAEVHIVDIDGEQWDIKDLSLTQRVALLEQAQELTSLENVNIELKTGYTASYHVIQSLVRSGKIVIGNIYLANIAGNNVGTKNRAIIGNVNIAPKKNITGLWYDYLNDKTVRYRITPEGEFSLEESIGVVSGSNLIRGQLVLMYD